MKSQKGYSKKRKTFNVPGYAHMLTFSCYKDRSFLKHDMPLLFLSESLQQAREKHGFNLWAYVFMPTHVHILIWPGEGEYSIEKILQSIKQPTSRRSVAYLKRSNPDKLKWLETGQKDGRYRFWQDGGGFDKSIDQTDILVEMVDYIHHNPVRVSFVENPVDWEWSSAKEWDEPGSGPISIDRETFPVLMK